MVHILIDILLLILWKFLITLLTWLWMTWALAIGASPILFLALNKVKLNICCIFNRLLLLSTWGAWILLFSLPFKWAYTRWTWWITFFYAWVWHLLLILFIYNYGIFVFFFVVIIVVALYILKWFKTFLIVIILCASKTIKRLIWTFNLAITFFECASTRRLKAGSSHLLWYFRTAITWLEITIVSLVFSGCEIWNFRPFQSIRTLSRFFIRVLMIILVKIITKI